MVSKNLVSCALLLLCTNTFAQDTLWTKTFGGDSADWGSSVCQTTDGGFIIAGGTRSFGAGNEDVYLIRTNSNGDTLWTKTFGGTGYDHGNSVQQTQDGGYIIVGGTTSYGAGGADVYLIKTNTVGDTFWTKTYGGSSAQMGESVWQTSDGGYIVAGWSLSNSSDSDGVLLIKTDSLGNMMWEKIYGDINCAAYGIKQTFDGRYIVCGHNANFSAGGWGIWLLKADFMGDTVWSRTYGGDSEDWGYSALQALDSGYVIIGYTYSYGAGEEDLWLIKTDSSGDTLWTRTYGGGGGDRGYSLQQTQDGGFIIAGYTASFGAGWGDVYLIRTDSNGDTIWTKTFGGTYSDVGYSICQTTDGGFIVAGGTESFGAGSADVYLIRLAPAAVEESDPKSILSSYSYPVFPGICIEYTLPTDMELSLKLYNITGTGIKTLQQGKQSQGKHSVYWNGEDDNGKKVGSGIYFYSLSANNICITNKFVLFTR